MDSSILSLTVVVLLATVLGIIFKLLRQPILIAYFFTGIIISLAGYFKFLPAFDHGILKTFSELGIMFLLFLIGLEMDFSSLKSLGKSILLISAGQVVLTFAGAFALLFYLLQFGLLASVYIAAALSFSSTVIVVKLLSEKGDANSLFGKISVGILLVQDFLAILILVFLTGFEHGNGSVSLSILSAVLKGLVLFGVMMYLGRKILPKLFEWVSASEEILFLSSLAWCFAVAAVVSLPAIGFPLATGGFLAGLALANSYKHYQISARIRSLRDFFVLIFFVILGTSVQFSGIASLAKPVIIISLFVLLVKPLIISAVMGISGYRKRTGFLTGVTHSQISEFSLILAALGLAVGHLDDSAVSLITLVGVITIAFSTYLITHGKQIFKKIAPAFSFFERKNLSEPFFGNSDFKKPIILIGFHRIGRSIAFNLPKEQLLVVEFDPEAIEFLKKHRYHYLFGDIADPEILERANFHEAELVISTDPDLSDNLQLINELKEMKKNGAKMKIVVRARNEKEVEALYREGADYVIFPHLTSGQYFGKSVMVDPQMQILDTLKSWDLEMLERLNRQ